MLTINTHILDKDRDCICLTETQNLSRGLVYSRYSIVCCIERTNNLDHMHSQFKPFQTGNRKKSKVLQFNFVLLIILDVLLQSFLQLHYGFLGEKIRIQNESIKFSFQIPIIFSVSLVPLHYLTLVNNSTHLTLFFKLCKYNTLMLVGLTLQYPPKFGFIYSARKFLLPNQFLKC